MLLGAIVIVVMGVIVVNYFRGLDNGLTNEGATTQPILTPGEGPVEYTVAAGETLWSISERQYGSGYNWVDIAEANGLVNANSIDAGQVLTVPDVEARVATVTGSDEIATPQGIAGGTYTVEKGDHLWDIAVRAYGDGYRWTDIAEVNGLTNPSLIHPGNVLSLPR